MDLIGGYGSDASSGEEEVALPTVTAAPTVVSFAHNNGAATHMVDANATTLTTNPTVGEMYTAVPVSAQRKSRKQRLGSAGRFSAAGTTAAAQHRNH